MPLNFVAKVAITAALTAAQMALTAMQHFEGQRLDDLKVTTADPGTPWPRFWGMRRFEGCPILWAEDLKEKKKTSKTKGGKYTDYKYYGTWMIGIAGHEIDAVRGIWLDKHLCYQSKGAGPITPILGDGTILNGAISGGPPVKLALGHNLKIYLGTETQMPDPRYEAWCEDKYGADSAPAYRGRAIAVFRDIPLEKFGNRIPQQAVEAVRTKASAYPVDTIAQSGASNTLQFSPGYRRLFGSVGGGTIRVVDVPSRTSMFSFASTAAGGWLGIGPTALYGLRSFPSTQLVAIGYDGGDTVVATSGSLIDEVFYVGSLICFRPYGGISAATYYFDGINVVGTARSFIADHYFEDMDGNAWAVGQVPGQNKVGFAQMPAGPEHLVNTSDDAVAYAMCNEDGKFVTWQAGKLRIVDPGTWTAGAPTTASLGSSDAETIFRNITPGSASIWLHNAEYRTTDASLIRTVTISNWGSYAGALLYDPINHAFIHQSSTELHWLYLDRIANDGVTLQTIADEIGELCGMTAFDTSAGSAITVQGWSVTQGTGREMLEPLFTLHDCDLAPHDFGQRIVKRAGVTAGATIATEDFARESDQRYSIAIAQDQDLPQRLTVNYADVGRDQQASNVVSMRSGDTTDSKRERSIDMTTYVSDPVEMQRYADRYLRRQWNERETLKNALTRRELALEPTDVRTQEVDGLTRVGRCVKITYSGGTLKCEWTRDAPTLATLSTGEGADMTGHAPDEVAVLGPTKGMVIDLPLVSDAHDSVLPQFYYGAGRYLASAAWPGATIWQAGADGGYDPWNDVSSFEDMTWGTADDALSNVPTPWLWDRGNTVTIAMKGSGTLASSTEAAIDADPAVNLARLGNEYVNFATATALGGGKYTLSGLKRGRRGTEWATGSHAAGDEFVLVSTLKRDTYGLSDVGLAESFKAATVGEDPDFSPTIAFTASGATLKPYAPARIVWSTDGTDMFGEVIRRTRVGGLWVGGSTIPLSEASEAYEVDVYHGSTFKRTIVVSGGNTFTYTGSQIAADGNTVGVAPPANVYQMSDAVGRGYALAA